MNTVHLTPSRATRQVLRQRPIGIKRIASSNDTRPSDAEFRAARKRASSTPQKPAEAGTELSNYTQDGSQLQHSKTTAGDLETLHEGQESHAHTSGQSEEPTGTRPARSGSRRLRAVSDAAKSVTNRFSMQSDERSQPRHDEYEYDHDVVDLLDVVDPEVSALTTLTNVQNSLFVPDLGRWLNRRPTYELSPGPSRQFQQDFAAAAARKPLPRTPSTGPLVPPKDGQPTELMSDIEEESSHGREHLGSPLGAVPSIASVVQEEHYAVLPHGVSLEGWTDEEKQLLDDYVRHMLHSKRSKFKRSMKAFGKYVSKREFMGLP